MTQRQHTGKAYDWNQARLNRINAAQTQSALAFARAQGMKARAISDPPTQMDLSLRFPFPGHRTCAEWTRFEAQQERRRG